MLPANTHLDPQLTRTLRLHACRHVQCHASEPSRCRLQARCHQSPHTGVAWLQATRLQRCLQATRTQAMRNHVSRLSSTRKHCSGPGEPPWLGVLHSTATLSSPSSPMCLVVHVVLCIVAGQSLCRPPTPASGALIRIATVFLWLTRPASVSGNCLRRKRGLHPTLAGSMCAAKALEALALRASWVPSKHLNVALPVQIVRTHSPVSREQRAVRRDCDHALTTTCCGLTHCADLMIAPRGGRLLTAPHQTVMLLFTTCAELD